MNKQTFIMGAIILMIASFFNRILGFIYRVFAVRIVGAEGIGLYEMVFPVYIMVLVIATAGFPFAISKLVSAHVARGNMGAAYKVFKIALIFLIISGTFFSIAMYAVLPYLSQYVFADTRIESIFKTMIPAIFLISVSSAFRGFFQGLQQMIPTALTQTVEQVVRVVIGLGIAYYLLPHSLELAVNGLAIGMVVGELMGLLVIIGIFLRKKAHLVPGTNQAQNISTFVILKDIHKLSVPITLTRVMASVIMAIEAMMLPQRLQAAGLTVNQATAVYGQYSGMALSLLILPTVLTLSLTVTLTPAISEAATHGNRHLIHSLIHKSLKLTILVGVFSGIIFYAYGPQLTAVLFDNIVAGEILQTLAFGCLFLYIQQTTTGILQGLGAVKVILVNSMVGGVIRLGGIYYLTALPEYGISGALITLNISFIMMAFLNILSISRITGLNINLWDHFLKPGICGIILIICNIVIMQFDNLVPENSFLGLATVLTICGLVYILALLITRTISISTIVTMLNKR